MVNKNKAQGTGYESKLVKQFRALEQYGVESDRYPLKGIKGEPDLYVKFGWPSERRNLSLRIPVLVWHRIVNTGEGPRKPDGERDVVVLSLVDFLALLEAVDEEVAARIEVQAKACERLNVTRVLADLRQSLNYVA